MCMLVFVYRYMQILLTKADSHYWSALFEGGEERSYRQLLADAVNADEPVVSHGTNTRQRTYPRLATCTCFSCHR